MPSRQDKRKMNNRRQLWRSIGLSNTPIPHRPRISRIDKYLDSYTWGGRCHCPYPQYNFQRTLTLGEVDVIARIISTIFQRTLTLGEVDVIAHILSIIYQRTLTLGEVDVIAHILSIIYQRTQLLHFGR